MQLPIEWLPEQGAPEQLILLFHGWASSGAAMAALAQALRGQFPRAAVLAPDAPHAADGGRIGCQWYSIKDLNEQVWAQRVEAALPDLQVWIAAQQRRLQVGPAATALGGFSQGAIVSLELVLRHDGLAGRVLAFGGRFVRPPQTAPRQTTLHLFHGADDQVIPAEGSRQALRDLGACEGDATLDIAKGVGHELHTALIACALTRLRSHIPARTWREALGAARASPSPSP